MGLLSLGQPLSWEDTKKYAKFVRERGISQFISIYKKSKNRVDEPFKWGDEVEYILVRFNHENKEAQVSLKSEEIFKRIDEQHQLQQIDSCWNPEFAAYMVEGTPNIPYGSDGLLIDGLCNVQKNLINRRNEVQSLLEENETIICLTNFPRLGCKNFTYPKYQPKPQTSETGSLFFPEEAIFGGHPRFKTLAKNIRTRRNRKVMINLPIFKDIKTPSPFREIFDEQEANNASKEDHIYMDAMGFGMGCCCLQVTFQATHMEQAKHLYDQLIPICPIALALSAGSPIYRGYLTDIDCRWQVISASVDDRTKEESGEAEQKEAKYRIPKSRYDSVSSYLSEKGQLYSDIPLVINKNYYNTMIKSGVDHPVARHIAHLFIRDPVTLYREKLEQTDEELDHFENIQSTNWQTMRFKPPPAHNSKIGWRVEFRPLELQTTDFENAAYVAFVILLSRVILAYKLDFLMPLSLVDANMIEAQKRDSVVSSKFWFRHQVTPKSSCKEPLSQSKGLSNSKDTAHNKNVKNGCLSLNGSNATTLSQSAKHVETNCAKLMSIDSIINGCEDFVGVLPLINNYVDSLNDGTNIDSIRIVKRYLKLISDRAAGRVMTTAHWIREFVRSHGDYKGDSYVSDVINYDLLQALDKLGKGLLTHPKLHGDYATANLQTSNGTNDSNINLDSLNKAIRGGFYTNKKNSVINTNLEHPQGTRFTKCSLHPSAKKPALLSSRSPSSSASTDRSFSR